MTEMKIIEHNGEQVVECLTFKEFAAYKDIKPGARVLREDGNVYTLGGDAYTLIDDEGFLVCPGRLVRFRRQEDFKMFLEVASYRYEHGF